MPGEPWTPPELPSAPGEKRPEGSPPPLLSIIPPSGTIGSSRKEIATAVRGTPIVLNERESFSVSAPATPFPCFFCSHDLRGEKIRLVNPHISYDGTLAWSIACETCSTKGAPPA